MQERPEVSVEREHLRVRQIGENAFRFHITCPQCGFTSVATPEVWAGEQPFVCPNGSCDFETLEDFSVLAETPLPESPAPPPAA